MCGIIISSIEYSSCIIILYWQTSKEPNEARLIIDLGRISFFNSEDVQSKQIPLALVGMTLCMHVGQKLFNLKELYSHNEIHQL